MQTKGVRTCVVCGSQKPKAGFARVVRASDGSVDYDPTGRAAGRGAYVCRDSACLYNARTRHNLERSLKVRIDEAGWSRLEKEFDILCAEHSDAQ